MALLNITLDQEEILQLLSENSGDAFKKLLTESLNSVLKAESQEQLCAAPYERTEERTDSRNGFRDRELKTRIGTLTLHVPRHRKEPFRTLIFENVCRSEAALIACMAEMVVNGVSTRKIGKVMEPRSRPANACNFIAQSTTAPLIKQTLYILSNIRAFVKPWEAN